MELRVEYEVASLQHSFEWRNIGIPRDIIWAGVRYRFIGMILRDWTPSAEHFSAFVKIDDKIYHHRGNREGLLHLCDWEGVTFERAIPPDTNIVPSRFYYVKADNSNHSGNWMNVEIRKDCISKVDDSSTKSNQPLLHSGGIERMEVERICKGTLRLKKNFNSDTGNEQPTVQVNEPPACSPESSKTGEQDIQKKQHFSETQAVQDISKDIISFPGYGWAEMKATDWTMPTNQEIDNVLKMDMDFSIDVMDTLGKVFQDYSIRPQWEASDPLDEACPPLFLTCRDRKCLQAAFIRDEMPVEILRDSEVCSNSAWIGEVLCITAESENQSSLRQYPRIPSAFLLWFQFRYPLPASTTPMTVATNVGESYWATLKLVPFQRPLSLFVRKKDRDRLAANRDITMATVNHECQIPHNYWGLGPCTYTMDDINFVDHPLASLEDVSGSVNAMFVHSVASQTTIEHHHLSALRPEDIRRRFHQVLKSVSGDWEIGHSIKRKADYSLPDRGNVIKRVRRSGENTISTDT